MPISDSFLAELTKKNADENFEQIFAKTKKILDECMSEISHKIPKFSSYKIYMQGAFINEVNTLDNTKLEIIIELERTAEDNFSEINYKTRSTLDKIMRVVKVKPKYSIEQFKKDLFLSLLDKFGNQKISQYNRNITILKNSQNPLTIELLPAFSFPNKNDKSGNPIKTIMIYESFSGNYTLSYPLVHIKNLKNKDARTNGRLTQIIRLFRKLRDILVEEETIKKGLAPGYFIDCLIYNCGDGLFEGENIRQVYVQIINYLFNADLSDFVCVHEQFSMFKNGYDSWNIPDARAFIKAVHFAYQNIYE